MENDQDKSVKQLAGLGLAVITLAVIVVMGMAILNGFSISVRDTTILAEAPITLGVANVPASLSSYPYVQAISGCRNVSNAVALAASNYTYTTNHLVDTITLSTAGGNQWNSTAINCSVTYKTANSASGAADTFSTGLVTFGTFIGLIILAFIGKIIIGMFKSGL